MKFHEDTMQFTDCSNYKFGTGTDIVVSLDDDLVPVSVMYSKVIPKPNAKVTITTAENGYIVTDGNNTKVVENVDSYYLRTALESMIQEHVVITKPFNQSDWPDTDFTHLAEEEIENANESR